GLAWANGIYVTVGYSGIIWWSPNLTEWMSSQSALTPHPTQLWEVFFGGGSFFAIGAEYSATLGNPLFLTSRDGVQWVTNAPGPFNTFGRSSIAYGYDTLVAIGGSRFSYTSADGANWSEHATGTDYGDLFNGIAFAGNTFVIAGGDHALST